MQNIDFNNLSKITPLLGDEWMDEKLISIDDEIAEMQSIVNSIDVQTIPWDRYDAIIIFFSSLTEILVDTFVGDPINPNSLAHMMNDSKSGIGKWCNKIHESIDHHNNPMDFQGGFTKDGQVVTHGSGIHADISYSGGDHRERTIDHDILRFVHAIKDYHDGVFRDAAFPGSEMAEKIVEVASTVNSKGNHFKPMSWSNAIIEYMCHMFADFFSSKGLPIPGHSFLSHVSDREIRKLAADIYKDGMNMRTQLLQSSTIFVAYIFTKAYIYLRYKDSDYSDLAKEKKANLLKLCSNSVATAFNIGKVVVSENPAHLNLPLILHTVRLGIQCMKEEMDYNQRVISRISIDCVRAQLLQERTFIIVAGGIYRTDNYNRICRQLEREINKSLSERQFYAKLVEEALADAEETQYTSEQKALEMSKMVNDLQIYIEESESLETVAQKSYIQDKEIDGMNIEGLTSNIK